MKPVFIFDMDGVIVDSEPLSDLYQESHFRSLGIDPIRAASLSYRGINSRTLWTNLKAEFALEQEVEALMSLSRAKFLAFLNEQPKLPAVPGARQLIRSLGRQNHRLALASSAGRPRIDLFLGKLGLAKHFEVIVSGDDVTHAKPHPEIFQAAANRLGASYKHCIVIEDAKAGVAAAKAAGMVCWGFTGLPHNTEDLSAADIIITDLAGLAKQIRNGQLPQ